MIGRTTSRCSSLNVLPSRLYMSFIRVLLGYLTECNCLYYSAAHAYLLFIAVANSPWSFHLMYPVYIRRKRAVHERWYQEDQSLCIYSKLSYQMVVENPSMARLLSWYFIHLIARCCVRKPVPLQFQKLRVAYYYTLRICRHGDASQDQTLSR